MNRDKGKRSLEMKKVSMALVAAIGVLLSSCGGKTEADFSIVPVKGSNGEYQYIDIDQKGKIVINPQFGKANIFRDGLALVRSSGREGKYGYIDKKGKFVIAPVYSVAQDFSEGVAWVQMEGQPPMLIDKKGKMLLQIDSLIQAYPFYDGIAAIGVFANGQEGFEFIDKKGKPAATTAEGVIITAPLTDGVYGFQNTESKKWGYKNKKGDIIINEQFDAVSQFFDGMAVVVSGGKFGAINKKGEYLINPQYDELGYDSDGLFSAKVGKKYGWVNKKGEIIINPQFDGAHAFFGNKLAPVTMGNKLAYIDRSGQIVINPQFDGALPFNGSYALVEGNGGKVGFINTKGEFVVHPLYDTDGIETFFEYAFASKQNSIGIPAQYFKGRANFNSYAKLEEKKQAYYEAEREAARKKAEQEMGELAKDAAPAVTELGTEAKKWQDAFVRKGQYDEVVSNSYKAYEGTYFSFKGTKDKYGYYRWSATSKVVIGDCPAKSVWKMEYGYESDEFAGNEVPPKCKSITPKVITDYSITNYGDE